MQDQSQRPSSLTQGQSKNSPTPDLERLEREIQKLEDDRVLHPDRIAGLKDASLRLRNVVQKLSGIQANIAAIREEIVEPVSSELRTSRRVHLVELFLGALSLILATLVFGGISARTMNLTKWEPPPRLATGQPWGAYYPIGVGLAASVAEASTDLSLEVLPTQGAVDNVKLILSGNADFGLVQSDIIADQDSSRRLSVVANLFDESWHIFVKANSGIYTLHDLTGTRVNVGPAEGGSVYASRKVLESCNVWVKENYDPQPEAIAKIVGDSLDAIMFWRAVPAPGFKQLVEDGTLRLLSLDDSVLEKRVVRQYYQAYTLPENAYGGRPVRTLNVQGLLVCSPKMSEWTVVRLLDAIARRAPDQGRHHEVLARVSASRFGRINSNWLHGGTVKYLARRRGEEQSRDIWK